MVRFKMQKDGGFAVYDDATGTGAYAYPTSEHATIARRLPERVADEMIVSANRFAASCDVAWRERLALDDYNARIVAMVEG